MSTSKFIEDRKTRIHAAKSKYGLGILLEDQLHPEREEGEVFLGNVIVADSSIGWKTTRYGASVYFVREGSFDFNECVDMPTLVPCFVLLSELVQKFPNMVAFGRDLEEFLNARSK